MASGRGPQTRPIFLATENEMKQDMESLRRELDQVVGQIVRELQLSELSPEVIRQEMRAVERALSEETTG